MDTTNISNLVITMLPWIIIVEIWDMIFRGIALWKSGRNNQMVWYICLLIFNTVGILPLLYLAFFQKKKEEKN